MSVVDPEEEGRIALADHEANPHYPLTLNSRHQRLMMGILSGLTYVEAARSVGMTASRVGQLMKSELFSREMARMKNAIKDEFVENEAGRHDRTHFTELLNKEQVKSLEKVIGLRDGADSEAVQHTSAMDILNMGGHGKTVKVQGVMEINADSGVAAMLGLAASEETLALQEPVAEEGESSVGVGAEEEDGSE